MHSAQSVTLRFCVVCLGMSDSNPFAFSGPFASDEYPEGIQPEDFPELGIPSDEEGDAMELEFQELEIEELPEEGDDDAEAFDDGTRWDDAEYEAERDFFESDF